MMLNWNKTVLGEKRMMLKTLDNLRKHLDWNSESFKIPQSQLVIFTSHWSKNSLQRWHFHLLGEQKTIFYIWLPHWLWKQSKDSCMWKRENHLRIKVTKESLKSSWSYIRHEKWYMHTSLLTYILFEESKHSEGQ